MATEYTTKHHLLIHLSNSYENLLLFKDKKCLKESFSFLRYLSIAILFSDNLVNSLRSPNLALMQSFYVKMIFIISLVNGKIYSRVIVAFWIHSY